MNTDNSFTAHAVQIITEFILTSCSSCCGKMRRDTEMSVYRFQICAVHISTVRIPLFYGDTTVIVF